MKLDPVTSAGIAIAAAQQDATYARMAGEQAHAQVDRARAGDEERPEQEQINVDQ
jgi:alpha-D-ribose 1-methylphosphonate 5-triphosphate synthase subunit PhnH